MLKIANITLKNNLILAPMAGYTNPSFRALMAKYGAGLTVTEMVSAIAINYQNEKTFDLLKTSEYEKVKCVQLFGSNPHEFERAVKTPQLKGFDIVDINMGCPVKKVVSIGSGSALMGNKERAGQIVDTLKNAGKIVTVKTRLGIDSTQEIFEFAQRVADCGADMIAVHCRTAKQMYSGAADYSCIKTLKSGLKIPVVVNGDITDSESLRRARGTGADGFMVGRGAIYNPLIFAEFGAWACGDGGRFDLSEWSESMSGTCGDGLAELSESGLESELEKKRIELIFELVDLMADELGQQKSAVELRKFFPYLLKGRAKKAQKHGLNYINNADDLKQELHKILYI